VAELARPLALELVAAVVGFEEGGAGELERLVDDMAAADGVGVSDELRRRAAATRESFAPRVLDALVRAPARHPDSVLAAVARERSPQLTELQVIDNTINMIFGAVDPTAILVATALWALLSHPDALGRVRAQRSLIPAAVAEAARWHPPFAASVRYVRTETELGGVVMHAGEKVYLMILSANRDERAFKRPERYDIARPDLRASIAFGRGLHFCIGEALASLAAREAIDVALSELPALRLDPERRSEPRGVDHHQLERLDVLHERA
jgi:cytochrome P450